MTSRALAPLVLAATALLFSVVVHAGVTAMPTKEKDKKKEQKDPVVAVFPFKVLNPQPQFQHFGEGASEAIVNKIVNDKAIKIVEESQIDKAINALARNQTGLFEEDSALAVGQMVDARFIVIGSVDVMADQIAVSARVLEVETRQLVVADRQYGPIATAFTLYDTLSSKLISAMTYNLSQRVSGAGTETADTIAVHQLLDEAKHNDPMFGGNDMPKALANYNKAVLRDPKSATARLALGHALSRSGDLKGGMENLTEATKLDPQNVFAWTELGRTQGQLSNHEAARNAFEHALAIDAKFVNARFGLAVALLNAGNLAAAKENAEQAKALGDARAYDLLGRIEQQIATAQQKPNPDATR